MRLFYIISILLLLFIPCILCIFAGSFYRFFGLLALAVWVYLGYIIMVEYLSYRDRNNDEEST